MIDAIPPSTRIDCALAALEADDMKSAKAKELGRMTIIGAGAHKPLAKVEQTVQALLAARKAADNEWPKAASVGSA